MRILSAAAVLAMLALMSFCVTFLFTGPPSGDQAYENTADTGQYLRYYWRCPAQDGYTNECLEMHIPQDVYETSMKRDVLRVPTVFDPVPLHFIESDDPYVQKVAEHILSVTDGMSDREKATAALWFVQSVVSYRTDAELYGTDEHWAYPVETLYLKRGDCEDSAILLCSVYRAMGLDCALLDYDGHVGVAVDYGEGYMFCNQTSDVLHEIHDKDLRFMGQEPTVYPVEDTHDRFSFLNRSIAGYRNLVYRTMGV